MCVFHIGYLPFFSTIFFFDHDTHDYLHIRTYIHLVTHVLWIVILWSSLHCDIYIYIYICTIYIVHCANDIVSRHHRCLYMICCLYYTATCVPFLLLFCSSEDLTVIIFNCKGRGQGTGGGGAEGWLLAMDQTTIKTPNPKGRLYIKIDL